MSARRPLVLACMAVSLVFASCGGGGGDADTITAMLIGVGHHPADLCTRFATAELLSRAGGPVSCLRHAAAPEAVDPNLKVLKVTVTGATATAQVQGRSGRNTISFVKNGHAWKISNVG